MMFWGLFRHNRVYWAVLNGPERLLNVLRCSVMWRSVLRHPLWFWAIQYSFCRILGVSFDVLGSSEAFQGVPIGSIRFPKILSFFLCSGIFWGIRIDYELFINVADDFEVFFDIVRCFERFWNVSEGSEAFGIILMDSKQFWKVSYEFEVFSDV